MPGMRCAPVVRAGSVDRLHWLVRSVVVVVTGAGITHPARLMDLHEPVRSVNLTGPLLGIH